MLKRVLASGAALLLVAGLTVTLAPTAQAAVTQPPTATAAPPTPAASAPQQAPAPTADTPDPTTLPAAAAAPFTLNGHIDLGSAGHPAGPTDVVITIWGWTSIEGGYWLHYNSELRPDAAGNFTLGSALPDVVLQYDYVGAGNFVSAYTSDFKQRPLASEPGVIHLTAPVTSLNSTLGVGATIAGSVTDTVHSLTDGLTALAVPSSGTRTTPRYVSTKVKSDGTYVLTGLPAGTYTVEFSGNDVRGSNFWQLWKGTPAHPEGVSITLATGGRADLTLETVKLQGRIAGYVDCGQDCLTANRSKLTLQAFDPVTSTWVTQLDPNLTRSSEDPRVAYEFPRLLPGTYRLAVDYLLQGDYDDLLTAPFTLNPGENRSASLVLVKHAIPSAGVSPAVSSFVTALYMDYLNRRPSSADVAWWGGKLAAGAPRSAVTAGFVNSDEYRLIRIDAAYNTVLGRAPDAGGRQSWLTAMQAGAITTDDIERSFYASWEYFTRKGGTDKTWAAALYSTLLGRSGSDTDYTFWANLAAQHGRDWVITQFWISPETIAAG
ncbi:DUF4214 domain-containing protein [Subtercola boreus]|uniref:DUF4214 domain-containing protein n=1 Tax=Subtercola boreus TaxID=120213 RepID=A0A3E0WAD3_9MICO|nr:DUF4214 domain-containing protein [Subtercola boreus]RFA21024.1 hypothetical protein B7R24_06345 [Subtercola boreus]RFA21408.1 hypothetical protein B7R23_06290 [Subtercola boreus]RFA27379.1 hypothetical protein B7R25_06415 [Subtercola boreus]